MNERQPSDLTKLAVQHLLRDHGQRLDELLFAAKRSESLPPNALFDLQRFVWILPDSSSE